jgi:predicted DCC family thiol-disulfide oxidoreductase YuxK
MSEESEAPREIPEENETQRKIFLLDDNDCTPCAEVKAKLKEEIESGKVEVLQVSSEEALRLLQQAGVGDEVEFPSAIVRDNKGVRLCQIYQTSDITLSKCGDEIIAIKEPAEETPPATD